MLYSSRWRKEEWIEVVYCADSFAVAMEKKVLAIFKAQNDQQAVAWCFEFWTRLWHEETAEERVKE